MGRRDWEVGGEKQREREMKGGGVVGYMLDQHRGGEERKRNGWGKGG